MVRIKNLLVQRIPSNWAGALSLDEEPLLYGFFLVGMAIYRTYWFKHYLSGYGATVIGRNGVFCGGIVVVIVIVGSVGEGRFPLLPWGNFVGIGGLILLLIVLVVVVVLFVICGLYERKGISY